LNRPTGIQLIRHVNRSIRSAGHPFDPSPCLPPGFSSSSHSARIIGADVNGPEQKRNPSSSQQHLIERISRRIFHGIMKSIHSLCSLITPCRSGREEFQTRRRGQDAGHHHGHEGTHEDPRTQQAGNLRTHSVRAHFSIRISVILEHIIDCKLNFSGIPLNISFFS